MLWLVGTLCLSLMHAGISERRLLLLFFCGSANTICVIFLFLLPSQVSAEFSKTI